MSLDWLYRGCGVLAAIALVMIALLILAQIIGRLFGFIIPSADELAGYSMGAATFLAMAYTFREGGHIRVTMIIHNLPKKVAYWLEIICVGFAMVLAGFFAWHMVIMVWQSYQFEAVSTGHLIIPLWIPQASLAFGIIVFFLALVEAFIYVVRGYMPNYDKSYVMETKSDKPS